jgi:predicted nucleic acid-binding protein
MTRTFLDSGVLIAAARGTEELAAVALEMIEDPDRELVSSVFVQLEILPKPVYYKQQAEVRFYETYFAAVTEHAGPDIAPAALQLAQRYGLAALDALHVAAAIALDADELVTTEGKGKPIHRVREIRIVGI